MLGFRGGLAFAVIEKAHDQADHTILLAGIAFGDKESEGDKRAVIETRPPLRTDEALVFVEIVQEEQASDAFIAVAERVVFDYEIEQMRGSGLNVGIKRRSAKRLLDCARRPARPSPRGSPNKAEASPLAARAFLNLAIC